MTVNPKIDKHKTLVAMHHKLPDELLVRISQSLPFVSRSNLSWVNNRFNKLLEPELKHEAAELRETYRSSNYQNSSWPGSPTLSKLLLNLLRGHIPGHFIENLTNSSDPNEDLLDPFDITEDDQALFKDHINQLSWPRAVTDLLSIDHKSTWPVRTVSVWPTLAAILPFLTNLRCLWLPCRYEHRLDQLHLFKIFTFIDQNLEKSIILPPFHRLSHIRVGCTAGSDRSSVWCDLVRVLALPSLRALWVDCGFAEDVDDWIKPYSSSSCVETVIFTNSLISRSGLEVLTAHIGVPCVLLYAWTENRSAHWRQVIPEFQWKTCRISGAVDGDTGLINTPSKTVEVSNHTEGTSEFDRVDAEIREIAKSLYGTHTYSH